jgi:hypothetical protein
VKKSWVTVENVLQVNTFFLDKGLLIVRTEDAKPCPLTTDNSFKLGSRNLFFYSNHSEMTNLDKRLNYNKQENLLRSLGYLGPISDVVYNSNRRDEIFLPVQIKQQSLAGESDVCYTRYVYPWLSNPLNQPFVFKGFEEFVTAGCLFGSSLQGKDACGYTIPLIKHDIKFYPRQQIHYILYDKETASPYEVQLLDEVEKLAIFINSYADPTKPKHLTYHLPYIDYMLFGIELFIRGRITLTALDKLIKVILEKREELSKKITEIFSRHNTSINITSPFENLFKVPNQKEIRKKLTQESTGELAKYFLDALKIPSTEVDPENLNDQALKDIERNFVHYCLNELQTKPFNSKHKGIWQKILAQTFLDKNSLQEKPFVDSINSLDDLFKLANSVMIAIAASGKQDNKTCSWLPLTEKQIQISYLNYSKKAELNWPSIFNATVLDSVVSYDCTNNGQLFYHGQQLVSQKNLLKKWHVKESRSSLRLDEEELTTQPSPTHMSTSEDLEGLSRSDTPSPLNAG